VTPTYYRTPQAFARIGSPKPLGPSKEESRDDIIESSLRREVFEELGIDIEIVRLLRKSPVNGLRAQAAGSSVTR